MTNPIEAAIWLVVVALAAMPVGAYQYKRILLLCAKQQTAEKLLDDKFYYLVPESEYAEYLTWSMK